MAIVTSIWRRASARCFLDTEPPARARALQLQVDRLWMALGDLYPSDAKIALTEKLAELYPAKGARVILGQSGSDAVSAAIKTAKLATGKPGCSRSKGDTTGSTMARSRRAACARAGARHLPIS